MSTLFFMGYAELARGNLQRATVLLEEALDLGWELDNRHIVAGCLMRLGITATLRDDPERAKTLLEKSLAINLELGTKNDIAETLEAMAELAGSMDERHRAARLWGAAEAIREAVGQSWSPTERLLHEPQLIAARTRLSEILWEAAFAEGRRMTLEEAVEYALSEEEPGPSTGPLRKRSPVGEPMINLTSREREIMYLVARGLTNRQVSTELSISERTAGNHVAKILRKLGLRSRAQIASWAAERQSLAADQD